MKKLKPLAPFLFLCCVVSFGQTPPSGVTKPPRPRLVSTKPAPPCSPRDWISAVDTGVKSVCKNDGSAWEDQAVAAGGVAGTVTSVSASGGTETTTGSAITSTGTIRAVEPVNAQASTASYAILDGDRGKLITFTRVPSSVAVSLAQAGTAGAFPAGWFCIVKKLTGGATITITPAVSTINGAATLDLTTGQSARIVSDGTNYQVEYLAGSGGISGLTPNTVPVADTATTLRDGQMIDDGTTVIIAPTGGTIIGDEETNQQGYIDVSPSAHTVTIGSDAVNLALSGNTSTASISAASAINLDSKGGVTTIGDGGGVQNGTKVTVNDPSQLVTVNGASVLQTNAIEPLTIAGSTVGDAGVPFSSVTIGNAANNSSQITGTFTANRVATLPDATGTVQLVGAANTGAVLTCLSNNTVLSTATGQVFTSPGNDGTPLTVTSEGAVGWVVTRAGTIRNLYVRTGTTAKVNTPATAIVVRKNGVDTTLTIAAMTQTTVTNSSDLAHSFSVAAGDVITVSLTTTGVAGVSTSIASITFELD